MSTQSTPRTRPAGGLRHYAWTFVVPVIVLLLGAALPWLWRNDLPPRLPLHWGVNGPDRFGSLIELTGLTTAIGIVVVVGIGWLTTILGKDVSTRRMGVISNNTLAFLLASIPVSTAYAARGLSDPASMTIPSLPIGIATAGGCALGVALALTVPRDTYSPALAPPTASAPRVALSDTETGVWVSRQFAGTSIWLAVGSIVVVSATTLLTQAWGLIVIPVLLTVIVVTFLAWDIRVDTQGVTLRSVSRLITLQIPHQEIDTAEVKEVSPLRDFGGWGWRTKRDGTVGLIVRAGTALDLRCTGGRRYVITAHDASTAAGLINTIIDRERPNPR